MMKKHFAFKGYKESSDWRVASLQQTSICFFFLSFLCSLFRLTIAEEGCEQILNHSDSANILTKLVNSLGVDEAGSCTTVNSPIEAPGA